MPDQEELQGTDLQHHRPWWKRLWAGWIAVLNPDEDPTESMVDPRTPARDYELTGATGETATEFCPITLRRMKDKGEVTLDLHNCPHCGRGHPSVALKQDQYNALFYVECPPLGGRRVYLDVTFTPWIPA